MAVDAARGLYQQRACKPDAGGGCVVGAFRPVGIRCAHPARARERAGQELSDGGRGHASRGSVHCAGQTEQKGCGASDGPPERQKGRVTIGADRRTLRERGRGRAAVLPSAIATSASLSLSITCSGVCLFLAVFPPFYGPIQTLYPDQFLRGKPSLQKRVKFLPLISGNSLCRHPAIVAHVKDSSNVNVPQSGLQGIRIGTEPAQVWCCFDLTICPGPDSVESRERDSAPLGAAGPAGSLQGFLRDNRPS